jgi:hypothetical protein
VVEGLETTDSLAYLDEANVGRLLTEALTADVEAVLADQTGLMGADAAVKGEKKYHVSPDVLSIANAVSMHRRVFSTLSSAFRPHPTRENIPLAGALAVAAGARVPDGFVRHDCGCRLTSVSSCR